MPLTLEEAGAFAVRCHELFADPCVLIALAPTDDWDGWFVGIRVEQDDCIPMEFYHHGDDDSRHNWPSPEALMEAVRKAIPRAGRDDPNGFIEEWKRRN